MLRVATVFSGIGAIEHSLERMGLQHEMVFACDNSDIDPFSGPKTTVLRDDPGTPVGSRLRVRLANARRKICTILERLEEHGATVGEIGCEMRCWHEECDVKDQELLEIAHVIPLSESPPLKDPMAWSNLRIYCANHHRAYDAGRDFENISPDLESYLRQAILSVDSPSARKLLVDELYGLSSRTPFVEQSYLANYEVPEGHFHKDVTFLDGTPYRDEVDLFVGGSPCQSFSFVGAQRGFEDARGTLFYDFVRLVDEIRPRMFIWENVKAVYSHDKGNTWDVISQCFDATGYTWHRAILNAKDYGIPQFRQRVFVVGFRDGGEGFEFPEPVELRTTMQDFLEDRVAGKYFLGTKGVDFVTWDKNHRKQYTQIDGEVMLCQKANQQFNWHGDFVFVEENEGQHRVDEKYFLSQKVERYVLASGTKGFSAKPETDLEVARPILATLFKNHRAGVDNYVTTEGRLRQLTPKECLRLMGFCDSFEQAVSNLQMYRQAGNSIVVDVLIAIMAQAIPVLAAEDVAFSGLQERAERVRELFDELPERQIQQSDLERVVAALVD